MRASLAVTCHKCAIDCGFAQYRTQYTPSRLRRSGVHRTVLPSPQSITHKYCPAILSAEYSPMHAFIQYLFYLLVVRLQFPVSDTDKGLPFELLALDPASGSASTCSPNDSPCPGVEYVFTLVMPGEQEAYWSISRGRSRHRSKVHQQVERQLRQVRSLSMSESRRCNVTTRR